MKIVSILIPPLIFVGLFFYSPRVTQAGELELVVLNVLCAILVMLPRLRSGLIRRRLFINTWMKRGTKIQSLLQGGSFYASVKLLIAIPLSLLMISELQHIHHKQWYVLIGSMAIASLCRVMFSRGLKSFLMDMPASVIAREWATGVFLLCAILALIPITLYLPQPNFHGIPLRDALLQLPQQESVGIFGILQQISAFKEISFWWLIMNIDTLLSGIPAWGILLAQWSLKCIYVAYSISVVYAFARLGAGLIELGDPLFYRFIGRKPVATSTMDINDLPSP